MRQAIHTLQAAAEAYGLVSEDTVSRITDKPSASVMANFLSTCLGGNFDGAYSILCNLVDRGYAPLDILGGLFRAAKGSTDPSQMTALRVRV